MNIRLQIAHDLGADGRSRLLTGDTFTLMSTFLCLGQYREVLQIACESQQATDSAYNPRDNHRESPVLLFTRPGIVYTCPGHECFTGAPWYAGHGCRACRPSWPEADPRADAGRWRSWQGRQCESWT